MFDLNFCVLLIGAKVCRRWRKFGGTKICSAMPFIIPWNFYYSGLFRPEK
jgi:hypothetical protein